jgi:hypothetical protein
MVNGKTVTRDVLLDAIPLFAGIKGLDIEDIKSIEPYKLFGKTSFYIVNILPEGWMLIAADDKAEPVLAYSKEGSFYSQNYPESMKVWLDDYSQMINRISQLDFLPVHQNWEGSSLKISSANNDVVEPLIKVKFNQSNPWNKYCPSDNNGRAVVGCVAVAMAQAMTVHKFPQRPAGYFGYNCPPYGNLFIDYNTEPAYDWNVIISGTDGKDAAARLLYHCGVSVEMGYSPSGSGTQTGKITNALKTYYSYPNSVKTYNRSSYPDDWESLIKNEIKHGRPVVYAGNDGTSNPGHAFNIDGYDGNSLYHINWGWGGQNNGYYTINNIKDGENDYTKGQQVIVGIRPPSVAPSDIFISSLSVAANQPAGTVVGTITIDSEATNPDYEYILKGPYSIFLHDFMPPSFYIENGELRTVRPFDIEDEQIPVSIKVTNKNNGLSYEKDFIIRIVEGTNTVDQVMLNFIDLNFVFTDKKLMIYDINNNMNYDIFNMSGFKVQSGILTTGSNIINMGDFQQGFYLFKTGNSLIKPVKLLVH